MSSPLIVEENGPVLLATMNRPERLNALDPALIEALRELFSSLRRLIRLQAESFHGQVTFLDFDNGDMKACLTNTLR